MGSTGASATRAHSAKGAARRAEIIDTTLRLMGERGYRKTSLRAIGRELGLEPAHLLHYFGSREGLFEAVIQAADDRYLNVRPGVETMFEAWVQLAAENTKQPGLIHLYTAFAAEAADANHPSRAFFQARWDRIRSVIIDELEQGVAAGRYRLTRTAFDAASALIAYSDGLQLHWLVNPTTDLATSLRAAIDLMVSNESTAAKRRTSNDSAHHR